MHGTLILENLLVVLALSVGVVTLFHRFRLPSIAGFILVGAVVGPHGLSLVRRNDEVEALAELGVVLLLFSIGLEFSIARLRRIWKLLLEGGTPYVAVVVLAGYAAARAGGIPSSGAIFAGFWVALSSTAIVLKILSDRREVDSPHGKLVIAILLFQDLCIVPMMLLLPALSGAASAQAPGIGRALVVALLLVPAVLLVARFLVPPLLAYIAHTRNRELFLLSVLLLCLGIAGAANRLGLSAALGAFLGGLFISKSDYSLQALSDILPFRDIFNSIFFMSIGMLLDLRLFVEHPVAVSLLGLAILVGKGAVGFAIAAALGFTTRVAWLAGIALAQVGEFSFVLARAGGELRLLPDGAFQMLLAASILTMAITPVLVSLSPRMASRMERVRLAPAAWTARRGRREGAEPAVESLADHVVVVGFGLNGRLVARLLSAEGIRYLLVDLNARAVREARGRGEPILFGDITSEEILRHLALDRARAVVILISDPEATRRALARIRKLHPFLPVIVRTRYVSEVDELHVLGATEVIPEEFETSIEIGARVLARFGTPIEQIRRHLEVVRADRYRSLRPLGLGRAAIDLIVERSRDVETDAFLVPDESPVAGLSLRELDLRGRTGAMALAVIRDQETTPNPNPALRLQPGDSIVLMGSPDQLNAARGLFLGEITVDSAAQNAPAEGRAP